MEQPFRPRPVLEFSQSHPFEVVNPMNGETLSRFTNFNAAMATAKALAHSYPRGLDILHEGNIVGHWGFTRPEIVHQ